MSPNRSRRLAPVAVVLGLLVTTVVTAGCGREEVPPGGPPASNPAGTTGTAHGPATTGATGTTGTGPRGTAPSAGPGQVIISDYDFTPNAVEIKVGDSVTWVNQDRFNHSLTSTDHQIESGLLTPGANFTKTFTAPGTYEYYCDIHNYMKGTVTVH